MVRLSLRPSGHHRVKRVLVWTTAFAVVSVLIAVLPAQAAPPGFVERAGTSLTLDGDPFRFVGINIYNANSDGTCAFSLSSGSGLDQALETLGPGITVLRSWFFQGMATRSGARDWSAFDHTIAAARARGVKVIPTLANQWKDCEPVAGFKDESWYTTRYREPDPGGTVSYRDFVAEVVARYRNEPAIMAWQLINEAEVKPSESAADCSANGAQILKDWAADVSGVIKSIDANHLVSLGTIGGGQCGASYLEYESVHDIPTIDLCEYHDYDPTAPMPGDEWNGLQRRIDQCRALNKPIFVGEAGINPTTVVDGQPLGLEGRAGLFADKFRMQMAAGVSGHMPWVFNGSGSTLDANYDITPGDPLLGMMARWGISLAALDPTFGRNGIVGTPASPIGPVSGEDRIQDIEIDPAGRIWVAGYLADVIPFVGRYTATGALDEGFGQSGRATLDGRAAWDAPVSLTLDSSGRPMLAARSADEARTRVARFTMSGAPDLDWDGDGVAEIEGMLIGGSAMDSAGRLVVAGSTSSGFTKVTRLNTNGGTDLTFAGGFVVTDFIEDRLDTPRSVVIDGAGRVVVGGHAPNDGCFVGRFLPTGELDSQFAGDGSVVVAEMEYCEALDVGTDNRPVLGGSTDIWKRPVDIAAARFLENGSLDSSFNEDGLFIEDVAGQFDRTHTVEVLPDGGVVLAGEIADRSWYTDMGLIFLASNGHRDASIGANGVLLADAAGWADGAHAVAVGDGEILVAGFGGHMHDLGVATAYEEHVAMARFRMPPRTPQLTINNVSVGEGDSGTSTATFTVGLFPPSATPVSVAYSTRDDTAAAPGDYLPAAGTLTFVPGDSAETVSVSVVGDTQMEPDESLIVELSGAVGATLSDASGRATIIDNDGLCTIRGTPAADVLLGTSGNDVICGFGGDDEISGGEGDDRIHGGLGNDQIDGGGGSDTADYSTSPSGVTVDLRTGSSAGGSGDDSLSAIENVRGSDDRAPISGNDRLIGDAGPNLLDGGAGYDQLWGNAGADVLLGGSEHDGFCIDSPDTSCHAGDDLIDGGPGDDEIDYHSVLAGGVTVDLNTDIATGGAGRDSIPGIEHVHGSPFDDVFLGDQGYNVLDGQKGADRLSGGGGDDYLFGNEGADVLDGGIGNDSIQGNEGIDTINGGLGNDQVDGGLGNDRIDGGLGTDLASFPGGFPGVIVNLATGRSSGGAGSDTLSGIENVVGSNWNDRITGSSASNVLDGSYGNDTIVGGGGVDTLRGREGNDRLNARDNSGGDVVDGGPQTDTCTTDPGDTRISCP